MSQIRVFHLEDYAIMRDGVRRLLHDDDAIKVVGEASNGNQMLERLKSIDVDVLIMDIYLDAMQDLKQMNGFEVCDILKRDYPGIKILAHSAYDDADKIARVLRAGASGFISKKSGFEELLHGVKSVAAGKFYVCLDTSKKLKNLNNFLTGIESSLVSNDEKFSKREREILQLLGGGKSSRQIAENLSITERTVETHRKNMIRKAEMNNTVELIAYAVTIGLVKN